MCNKKKIQTFSRNRFLSSGDNINNTITKVVWGALLGGYRLLLKDFRGFNVVVAVDQKIL